MSQKKPTFAPTPEEVGRLYDRFAALDPEMTTDYLNNQHCGYWDNPDSEVLFGEATDRMTDIMVEKLKIGPKSHVLDVGCGVGGPGVRIARLTGARVAGISISQEQITLANSLAESAGLAERVVFQWANAMELPFAAQSFDAAIAIESITHMPDRGQVLSQICRVLRPGGRLVLTDLFERAPIPAAKQPVVTRFLNYFMATMVQAENYPPLLRQAGLWFEEILDISEQTVRKSFMQLSTLLNQARPDLEANSGDEMTGRSDITDIDMTDIINITEYGFLMIVAKRPEGVVNLFAGSS